MTPEEYARFAYDLNVHFTQNVELDKERQRVGCNFMIVAVATCGIAMFLGGMCYICKTVSGMYVFLSISFHDPLQCINYLVNRNARLKSSPMSVHPSHCTVDSGPTAVFSSFCDRRLLA